MKIIKNTRRVRAFLLGIIMMVTGVLSCTPEDVQAASYEDQIVYDEVSDAVYLYNSDEAPIKPGYVFGGWFEDRQGVTQVVKEQITDEDTVYAKFVPAYVLSVKAQNQKNEDGTINIRLISGVDSDQHYKAIGFEVYLGNNLKRYNQAGGTYIYENIKADGKSYEPEQLFGDNAHFFNVVLISNIKEINFSSIIYARPYWITKDGTKVCGLPKYVSVQDGEEEIVSIPINLCTNAEVAVGIMSMSYSDTLEYVGYHYENKTNRNRLFQSVKVNVDKENNIIQCVGNVTDGSNRSADQDIYISLKFRIKDATKQLGDERYYLYINDTDFCDWNQREVPMKDYAWDVQY